MAQRVKSSLAMQETQEIRVPIPGSGKFLGGGNGNPCQVSLPGKSLEWRSLAGFSPWGRKELNTTEQLSVNIAYTVCLKSQD